MAPSHLRWPLKLSIAAAVVTIGMKGTAYAVTGSVGLFSDALESGVNLFAAVVAYLSLLYAARPADPGHAYGHEKIEYLSSGLEGALVLAAGLGTAGYAVRRLIYPEPLANLEIGTAIALAASAVNLAVARVLLHHGRKHRSVLLEADGHHLMSDVWTSVGVVAGIGLVLLTGRQWLDAVVAAAVGLNIMWTGGDLIRRSFDGLMDHALPTAEQDQLRAVITARLPPGATFHALRTRQAGARRFAEFHLLVAGDQSVRAAHHLGHEIEAALVEALPGLEVLFHVEPVEERESWEGEYLERLGEAPHPPGAADAR
ncbi:cation diffusion facilitator family transporter [Urbifossiella limnaea]|uniref:Ferrous-iron efflux pump FieF n=1 Tax=Urbifossiella limnaea TaxID=2528023 RepID=A0A517XTM9_9BACT|nr:cation diffusion facilitator family transporter [Urbifossiella limnaea]QDU20855.1 Ferrous-iron efflux pump FieF [Urbifossiella limnaea]